MSYYAIKEKASGKILFFSEDESSLKVKKENLILQKALLDMKVNIEELKLKMANIDDFVLFKCKVVEDQELNI